MEQKVIHTSIIALKLRVGGNLPYITECTFYITEAKEILEN